jgi:hypothetical protein
MELLLGCGFVHNKMLWPTFGKQEWESLHTVDINESCNPDTIWDLNKIPLPFDNNIASEIHAYNVFEHTGFQGDYKFFFKQFEDLWRILKPDGYLFASTPWWNSLWALGDPGHTRVINNGTITFLCQDQYKNCSTSMRTDYRWCYKGNFKIVHSEVKDETYYFSLQAIK